MDCGFCSTLGSSSRLSLQAYSHTEGNVKKKKNHGKYQTFSLNE